MSKVPLPQAMTQAAQLHQQGKLDAAEPIYRAVVSQESGFFDAIHLLGVLCFQTGRPSEALDWLNKALETNAQSSEAFYNRGLVLVALERPNDALQSYDSALSLQPGNIMAQFSRAAALKSVGRLEDALASYGEILALSPDHANAHNDRGNVLTRLGRHDEALSSYGEALKHAPENATVCFNRGNLLAALERFEEALSDYEEALRLNPNDANVYNNRGGLFRRIGERDRAIESYQKSISILPAKGSAHRHLSLLNDYSAADMAHAEQIESILGNGELPQSERMHLHFALGKIYADCRTQDKAFENYRRANDIRARQYAFDRESHTRLVDRLIEVYSDSLFQTCENRGNRSKLPVLIVGMPRSGTTLIEQIISSHPEAAAGGELRTMAEIEKAVVENADSQKRYPDCVPSLSEKQWFDCSERYLEDLRSISNDHARVSDKMPRNFLSIGFFKILFPDAYIIHCRRDPLDTCLSIYFNYFTEGNYYSFELESLGHYYNEYQRMMEHWRKSPYIGIHEVQYEELIGSQEEVSRQLIEYLELEWDDRCVDFHENKRPVNTASSEQVRQPIYSSSIGRWKEYERHLKPLMDMLER